MKLFLFLWSITLVDLSTACLTDCSQVTCLQHVDPFSCPDDTIFVKDAALCGCCPGCVRHRGPGDQCRGNSDITFDIRNYYTAKSTLPTVVPPVVLSDNCAPGLKCLDSKCSDYTYKCHDDTNTEWQPKCDVDGSFRAVQCKSNAEHRRCFCYNKGGERIFGYDWYDPDKPNNMHCLCSRLVDELMKKGNYKNQKTSYHCSQNGNFERLQCNDQFCYCADPYTGQSLSVLVPYQLWDTLTCYNDTTNGATYLRNCDSQSNALVQLSTEIVEHGGSDPTDTKESPPCDPDGSYAPKQCETYECHCSTKANERIPPYNTERPSKEEISQNCYCARDKVLYNSLGLTHSYVCDGAGNYKTLQRIGNNAFCMDADGFPSSKPVPMEDICNLPCQDPAQCPDPSRQLH